MRVIPVKEECQLIFLLWVMISKNLMLLVVKPRLDLCKLFDSFAVGGCFEHGEG